MYLYWLSFILIAPRNKCSGALNVIELVIKVVFRLHMYMSTCEVGIYMRGTLCTVVVRRAQIA